MGKRTNASLAEKNIKNWVKPLGAGRTLWMRADLAEDRDTLEVCLSPLLPLPSLFSRSEEPPSGAPTGEEGLR